MTKQAKRSLLLSAFAMLALILDGRTALLGAQEGVALCLKTVIPSLLPFLFFSSLITSALWGVSWRVFSGLSAALGIPKGGEGILISGFLGGYPAGAQAVAESHRTGCLPRQTAEHLLMFCSNAGPAFLFGMVARQFPEGIWVWKLWLVQLLSAVMTGFLTAGENEAAVALPARQADPSRILSESVKVMGLICGWIILFRMGLTILDRWVFWAVPESVRVIVSGFLELSNGCLMLEGIENVQLRFLICCGMLSFGGLCVMLQTASVIAPLPLKPYLQGKLLQTGLSLLIGLGLLRGFGWLLIPSVFLPVLKKRGSKTAASRV